MKRFHVNVSVSDLDQSIRFYETLFGEQATVVKKDYAKWMLDDPRINFSISESASLRGVNHVGLQVESDDELAAIQSRLDEAGQQSFPQPEAECCYAKSSKTWVRDPDGVAWESFLTHGQLTRYGSDHVPGMDDDSGGEEKARCCA